MALAATELRVGALSKRQVSALQRKAGRLGLTPEDYIRQLIKEDLALDRKAANTSLAELSAPFRKALHGMEDHEIDRIVRVARAKANGKR